MKTVFLVWFDNGEEYIENHERYILKALSTKLKAEKFVEKHCSERYTPDVSFEQFTCRYAFEKEKSYLRYCLEEEEKFMYTRDRNKLSIEEMKLG